MLVYANAVVLSIKRHWGFVKRNFLGAGKSYMIKWQQAEKKGKNTPCELLKCVFVTRR